MGNDTFKNQLAKTFNRETDHKEVRLIDLKLPRLTDWKGDGNDFINVSPVGNTDLGQILHPTSSLEFVHDAFGKFVSISAFWDYLETGAKENRLRRLGGKARSELKKSLTSYEVPNLKFLILDAVWQRINQYPLLKDALRDSELPFDIIRSEAGQRLPRRQFSMLWYIEGLEVIRRAVKANTGPSFSELVEGRSRRKVIDEYLQIFVPAYTSKPANKTNSLLEALRLSTTKTEETVEQTEKELPAVENKVVEESQTVEEVQEQKTVAEQENANDEITALNA